jgi:hypothetical protein
MAEVVRTLAHAVLALSAAGAVYSGGALAIQAAGPHLSERAQELCWRLLGVKLAGVAIMVVAITGG